MEEEESSETEDKLVIYKQILEILKPGETVLKVHIVSTVGNEDMS